MPNPVFACHSTVVGEDGLTTRKEAFVVCVRDAVSDDVATPGQVYASVCVVVGGAISDNRIVRDGNSGVIRSVRYEQSLRSESSWR